MEPAPGPALGAPSKKTALRHKKFFMGLCSGLLAARNDEPPQPPKDQRPNTNLPKTKKATITQPRRQKRNPPPSTPGHTGQNGIRGFDYLLPNILNHIWTISGKNMKDA